MISLPGLLLFLFLLAHLAAEDKDLARRIRMGDHGAYQDFFEAHYAALLAFLRRRGMDAAAAEDLVQQAFILIWEKRAQIDPNKSLRAYLFRIGYTRALNQFRFDAKFDRGFEFESAQSLTTEGGDVAELGRLQASLDEAVAALPERRRAIFELCFLQGLTYREAAEALEVSQKTIENQMGYALKSIRQALSIYRKV